MATDLGALHGRVALVTGAGRGVGRGIALHLAAHGAGGVIVNDFFLERAEEVAGEISSAGGEAMAAQGDVTDIEQVADMVRAGEQRFGRIDILVNNAGNDGPRSGSAEIPFWESEPEDWEPWIRVNFHGVLNCSRRVLPGMISRKDGRIINVISDAGRVGEPHLVVYSGAKAAAAGFTRGLAKAVGRYTVTVNAVALGVTRTPATQPLLDDEENRRKMLRSYPIRRVGEASDVANMAVFLASDAASWITGQTYPVNGGYSFSM